MDLLDRRLLNTLRSHAWKNLFLPNEDSAASRDGHKSLRKVDMYAELTFDGWVLVITGSIRIKAENSRG